MKKLLKMIFDYEGYLDDKAEQAVENIKRGWENDRKLVGGNYKYLVKILDKKENLIKAMGFNDRKDIVFNLADMFKNKEVETVWVYQICNDCVMPIKIFGKEGVEDVEYWKNIVEGKSIWIW